MSRAGRLSTGWAIATIAGVALSLSACSSSSPTTSSSPSQPASSPTPKPLALLHPAPHGYVYSPAPAEFDGLQKAMSDMGLVTASEGQAATTTSGAKSAVVIVFQYNPAISSKLDKSKIDRVLDGSVKGAASAAGAGARSQSLVLSGHHVRIISSASMTIGIAYEKGGKLIEFFGPHKAAVTSFMKAYLS